MEFGMWDDKVSWEDTEQLDSCNEHTSWSMNTRDQLCNWRGGVSKLTLTENIYSRRSDMKLWSFEVFVYINKTQ